MTEQEIREGAAALLREMADILRREDLDRAGMEAAYREASAQYPAEVLEFAAKAMWSRLRHVRPGGNA